MRMRVYLYVCYVLENKRYRRVMIIVVEKTSGQASRDFRGICHNYFNEQRTFYKLEKFWVSHAEDVPI